MSTASFDAGRPRTRSNWFTALFGATSESLPLEDWALRNEHSCRIDPSEPIELFAEGDVLSFKIFPSYEWKGRAESREELYGFAQRLMPRARAIVVRRLRPIARAHPPQRADRLEEEVNKALEEDWRRLTDGDRELWFRVTVRVEHDDLVLEQLRPYWAARIKAECDHRLGLQRAHQADELTRRWSDIFEHLESDPRAADAARLSEEVFASVFSTYVGNRREAVKDLLNLLRAAVDRHNDVGLGPSEYTTAWDEAIKAFRRQYGLDPQE
ncbi:hypothetical protein Ade02nite_83160 [Paractinoplanes deccanensis]|uniref:Uncharacterized protein n=1 Tax=Paractinoplanes deccanensis TaxID=113561 RepID=A0ABQ3YIC7_9ACTN|nr:hypothetical protein [Actinoplanes deccanensis]GID79675.1 hypothetical protein Ade02nite_83160 [Actinoplanes deccanensis]